MRSHKFQIGQPVILRSLFLKRDASDAFRIVGQLPERGGTPQYRIRTQDEPHDRVVNEDQLAAAEPHDSDAAPQM